MNSIKARDLMVPLEEYATVSIEAALPEAVLSLEKAQTTLDPSRHKHRAILVLDETGKVVSKITMKHVLTALEPNYGKLEGIEVLERSGHSPDMINRMLEDHALWIEPLEFLHERAANLKVRDFIQPLSECEYIDADASLHEAIHRMIVCPYLSLLVTSADEVIGILRLSDVFTKVCDIIKGGES
jgi:CBS domain-containing protein